MKKYEAMFLMDGGHAAAHWDERIDEIKGLFERHDCSILRLTKWDDRRLAYPIEHHKRGTYVLCFYEAPREANVKIERDVQLSDNLLRVIIIRREKMTTEQMSACRIPSRDPDIINNVTPAAPPDDAPAVEGETSTATMTGPDAAPQATAAAAETSTATMTEPDAAPEATAADDAMEADGDAAK